MVPHYGEKRLPLEQRMSFVPVMQADILITKQVFPWRVNSAQVIKFLITKQVINQFMKK